MWICKGLGNENCCWSLWNSRDVLTAVLGSVDNGEGVTNEPKDEERKNEEEGIDVTGYDREAEESG